MPRYANLSGDSGVRMYEVGDGFIKVGFVNGTEYLYTDASAGRANIERMIALARAGRGLSTFISRVVKDAYAERLR